VTACVIVTVFKCCKKKGLAGIGLYEIHLNKKTMTMAFGCNLTTVSSPYYCALCAGGMRCALSPGGIGKEKTGFEIKASAGEFPNAMTP
jgi:hypothetical protein